MRAQFLNRPLLVVLLGFSAGLSFTFGIWPALLFAFFTIWLKSWKLSVFAALSLAAGFFLKPPVPGGWFEPFAFQGTLTVASVPDRYADGVGCLVEAQGVRYRLNAPPTPMFTLGDQIRVSGELGPLGEASGYSGGAQGTIRAKSATVIATGPPWWHWGQSASESFRTIVESRLTPRSAALVKGVCFNQTAGLDLDDWEAFRRFGVVHLLSASGFHVAIVAGALLWLASLLPIPRVVQLGAVFAVLALFAVAAGFKPPIVRAVFMAAVALSAYLFRREADGLTAVSLAGLATLAWAPAAIADLGFHLSMAATLGLVTVVTRPRWQKWGPTLRVTVPTLAATAAVFPLTGYVFGEISILGLVGNLIAGPLVGVLVVAALAAWVGTVLVPPIGGLLFKAIEPFAAMTMDLVDTMGRLPGSTVPVPPYSVVGLCCLYGFLVLAWGRYAVD